MSLSMKQTELKQRFIAERGRWSEDWEALLKINPDYLAGYISIRYASQGKGRLSPKIQEFIYIAVAASTTHIHVPSIRAHIHAALDLGATAEEIMEVIGLTYLVGIHTVTLGAPILQELMEEENMTGTSSSILDEHQERIKNNFIERRGFWTDTWNPLLELDPDFFDAYMKFSSISSNTSLLEPKVRELITCAFDAATTHLYGRGTKIHMRNALRLGATTGEIMEMLEITSLMGIHGVISSVPILADSLDIGVIRKPKNTIVNGTEEEQ